LITVRQAAKLFKVSVSTIYRWAKEDSLKSKKGLYSANGLQKAYDKRKVSKPRLRCKI
jgi:transposase